MKVKYYYVTRLKSHNNLKDIQEKYEHICRTKHWAIKQVIAPNIKN